MACDPQLLLNLADAKTAYHNLNTGKMARVIVDQNGERVEFAAARKSDLYTYIQQLEREVALCSATPGVLTRPANGPAGFIF